MLCDERGNAVLLIMLENILYKPPYCAKGYYII